VLSLVPGHLGGTSTAGGTARPERVVPCLGLKFGTLGGMARHGCLFVPRRAVPSRAVPRRAWAGSCRAAHLAIYSLWFNGMKIPKRKLELIYMKNCMNRQLLPIP